jgi:hypothetical protein
VPLSEGTPTGDWTFESRVDGQAAGQVSFEVVVAAKPASVGVVPSPERALPSPAEIYAHAVAASIDVEKLDAKGHTIHHSSGFLLRDGLVATSFRGIDGATSLHLHLLTGEQLPSPSIAAWDRRQDWVLLATSSVTNPPLKLAEPKTWKVGDHCYWLDVKSDGGRILSDGDVVGLKSPSLWGDRIDFSGVFDSAAMGGALMDDRGEIIGILGGALPESLINSHAPHLQPDSEVVFYTVGGIAVASNFLPQSLPSSPVSLQFLGEQGLMTRPLTGSNYILFALLTEGSRTSDKKTSSVSRDYKSQFQRGDSSANALIHFTNSASFKSSGMLKLYDLDKRLAASSSPEMISVNRGEHVERVWQLPLTNLPVGIYRVDFELTEGVAWRQYFKLAD